MTGRWYLTQTLLYTGGSNTNQRILNGPNGASFTFNERMGEWHDDATLQRLCDFLNQPDKPVPGDYGPDIDFG